jgi:hypothetical protein
MALLFEAIIPSGSDVPSNQPYSCSSIAGVVPVGHLRDAAGYRDQGDRDCKSLWCGW